MAEQQRYWLQIGMDAYQMFAFYRAAKAKMRMDSGSCFAAGTNVIVGVNEDGTLVTKPIEEVEEDDYILSRDQYDAEDDLSPRRVTGVFRRTSDHIRTLTIEGDDGNVEVIRTTDEHPFYVQGRGWTEAGDLAVGDLVQETDGSWQTVLGSTREAFASGIAVYNLELEGDHTYFVEDGFGSTDAVWVHNYCAKSTFFGRLKGKKPVAFKNAPATRCKFTKQSAQTVAELREAFNGTPEGMWRDGARGNYIK